MDRRTKAIVATLCFVALMIGTDFTGALLLVVPIEHEFSVDITITQWVLNIYALTFSMVIVSGGRLGDMFGRRRLLLIGLAIFFVASIVCTVAPSITWLIGARAVQGVGSAIVWPCLIGLAMTVIDEKDRGLVMGLIIGATASGNVVGPVIAGVVSGVGEWRLFFLINVIMALVSASLILLILKNEPAERVEERVDYAGMAVLSIAILALLYGLDIGTDGAWA
ncbi:MAG: MFS transporter, partial [Rhodospirillaceae bacterium]|nr:MFS transporter [Rhodospirillaceae bacterium]